MTAKAKTAQPTPIATLASIARAVREKANEADRAAVAAHAHPEPGAKLAANRRHDQLQGLWDSVAETILQLPALDRTDALTQLNALAVSIDTRTNDEDENERIRCRNMLALASVFAFLADGADARAAEIERGHNPALTPITAADIGQGGGR